MTTNRNFLILLCLSFTISSCSDNFESKVYGSANKIVFEILSSNYVKVGGFAVYTKLTDKSGLVQKLWEIKFPSNLNWNKNKDLKIIHYGITPKGFLQTVEPVLLQESTIYTYSIEAGKYESSGCFYIKNNQVIQDNIHC